VTLRLTIYSCRCGTILGLTISEKEIDVGCCEWDEQRKRVGNAWKSVTYLGARNKRGKNGAALMSS